jgi:hypothetical protein
VAADKTVLNEVHKVKKNNVKNVKAKSCKFLSKVLKNLSHETVPLRRKPQLKILKNYNLINNVTTDVADSGCLSLIRFFASRIQGQKDSGSQIRIRIKENCF